uniref:Uncharacterized protein n=1 Tax=Tanacetum cinerariifolium TaxID=118510 RepID=A0A6L2JYG2_TANCI|nr:hypothetical protein [Tanacetum cinerariifolium]
MSENEGDHCATHNIQTHHNWWLVRQWRWLVVRGGWRGGDEGGSGLATDEDGDGSGGTHQLKMVERRLEMAAMVVAGDGGKTNAPYGAILITKHTLDGAATQTHLICAKIQIQTHHNWWLVRQWRWLVVRGGWRGGDEGGSGLATDEDGDGSGGTHQLKMVERRLEMAAMVVAGDGG